MSQMQPDAPPRTARPAGAPRPGGAPPAQGGAAAFLTRKLGPFPIWVWIAVVGGLFGWRYVASHKAGASSSTAGTSTDTGTSASTDASQVPQFVNQTYTSVTAPSAPPPHGGLTPAPALSRVRQYRPPTGLTSSVSGKSATLTWNLAGQPSPAPTSYTVEVFNAKGGHVLTQTVDVPDTTGGRGTVTLPSLPKGSMTANVWANGGEVAPPHTQTKFTVR